MPREFWNKLFKINVIFYSDASLCYLMKPICGATKMCERKNYTNFYPLSEIGGFKD